MNITAAIITFILMIVLGVIFFASLILGLNGFTSNEAEPGILFYIVWLLIASLISSLTAYFGCRFFIAKAWNPALAVIVSIVGALVLGFIINVVGFFASLILTSWYAEWNKNKRLNG